MYYGDEYYENKIKDDYLMSFDEIIEFYKDNFMYKFTEDNNCYKIIAVFGSKNKFNFAKTNEINILIKQLNYGFDEMFKKYLMDKYKFVCEE